MPGRLIRSFAYRTTLAVLVFSLVLSLLSAAGLFALQYREAVEAVELDLERVGRVSAPSISGSLWVMDRQELQIHLDALLTLPYVNRVTIEDKGRVLAAAGTARPGRVIERSFPLQYTLGARTVDLGALRLQASRSNLYSDLSSKTRVRLLLQTVQIFLVAAFTLMLLRSMVTRRLSALEDHLGRLDAGRLDAPLQLPKARFFRGDDELDHVARTVSAMGANLREAFGECRQAEQEIRRLNAGLEDRVRERTAQLEVTNRELEAFCYSVSHDLRAPLRAIEGFAGIVYEDYGGRLDPGGQRLLDVIRANARKMSQLIDDLLSFSRVGRSRLQLGRLDMAAMARSAFGEIVAESAAQDRIDFVVGDLPVAAGDAALMQRVWYNLLANAVKFSGQRERPAIEVSGGPEGEEVVYHVRDNGAGFDMQYADKLYGVFQRLHAADQFEGTGIGLALVQRIVVRHGGRVWARGDVGRGAEFSFSLPAEPGSVDAP